MGQWYFQEELPTFVTGYRRILFQDQFNMPHVFLFRSRDCQLQLFQGQTYGGHAFHDTYQAKVLKEIESLSYPEDAFRRCTEEDFVPNPIL